MTSTLEKIISPKRKVDFFEFYNKNLSFVIHENKESIKELLELPFLQSLEDMLKNWDYNVDAFLPDICDEYSKVEVSSDEAKKLFKDGLSILFNDVNRISPVLADWVEQVKYDIGLSKLTYARNLVYATPATKGTAPHFDQNINLVIQIHGTKKWWIAPNEHVENPMTRHTMGQHSDDELESYINKPFPTTMPQNATLYTLKPGSVLFVPRGSWHTTEALTDALSLNFTFSPPTWIDLLTTTLRARLAQSSEWRETADFVTDEVNCHKAIDKFDMLLSELAYELPNWRAEQILEVTEAEKFPLE